MAAAVEGQQVTFTPPVGAVGLLGDFTDWRKRPPIPVVAGQAIQLSLPRGAWVEYAWLDAAGEAFADPDNAQKSLNPWWSYPRAVAVGEFQRHPLWLGPDAALTGTAHRLTWPGTVFPGTRRAIVYTPHGHEPGQSAPVYYVQDGVAFYRTGRLGDLLDRALERGAAQPAVLVFVEPGDRNEEYYLNDRYLDFLTQEVFPRVEGEFVSPTRRGLWGASLGGLISLYLGLKHPEVFQRVVSHSGAFIARPGALDTQGVIDTTTAGEWLLGEVARHPPTHLKISLDSGVLEWLSGPNRRMAGLLADLRLDHQYREYASGHNWVTWREALPEALLFMQGCETCVTPAFHDREAQLVQATSDALRELRREGNLTEEEIAALVEQELRRPL